MLQMTFVICIAILSNYFGGEAKFVLVAKVKKSLTRIFSEKISECFRINTNASKTWLKYRPGLVTTIKSGSIRMLARAVPLSIMYLSPLHY